MATEYYALIPAYEPGQEMLDVILDMKTRGFTVVVVDDGSGPDYEDIFRSAAEEATILSHDTNKGKGAALRTGLRYISEYRIRGDLTSVVVTVDADGQHLAADAMKIARIAAGSPGWLVLGSRALKDDVPARSKFGNTVTRHVYRLATGVSVHDTQTGLRAFTSDLIPDLLSTSGDRYEYEINVLMDFARRGVPIREETIETIYMDNNRNSHFCTIRDSARIYKEILKFSASSFIGFMVDYGMYALLLAIMGLVASGKFTVLQSLTGGNAQAVAAAYGLVIANVGARIVSSITNYTINRKFVFKSSKSVGKSALQYFTLAAFILAGNTVVLSTLVGRLGIGRMIAKIITEIIFFTISWLVQRYLIFYDREAAYQNAGAESGNNSTSSMKGQGTIE